VTLGDTTITLYLTPGHTPGTISFLIPVTDGGQRHLAAEWGGTQFRFTPTPENFRIYASSAERFRDIVARAGADTIIANHRSSMTRTTGRRSWLSANLASPNPYVIGTQAVTGYLTVAAECVKAAGLAAATR
jgi:metallo-beta-lactamase class B